MLKIIEIVDYDLLKILAVLPIVIVVNVLLGGKIARDNGAFNSTLFWEGLKKGLTVYLAIIVMVIVGYIMPDIVIVFNGSAYDIPETMYLIVMAKTLISAGEVVNKIIDIMGLKVTDLNVKEIELDDEPLIDSEEGDVM